MTSGSSGMGGASSSMGGGLCGNAMLDEGETCDTAIASGEGACPVTCDDTIDCTTDILDGEACGAHCVYVEITSAANGDMCCPPGADASTDDDCSCGNGAVDPGEACDTLIAPGMEGACPASCDDAMACTSDVLAQAGTCLAACEYPAITNLVNGDMCCPPGGNIGNDSDCPARCGDGVVTPPEQCDSNVACNACTAETAFRFTKLELKDPHTFDVFASTCTDVTLLLDRASAAAIDQDQTGDGVLDLNFVHAFRPLDARNGVSVASEVNRPSCASPAPGLACTLPAGSPVSGGVSTFHMDGECVGLIPMTTRASYGTITTATASGTFGNMCFDSNIGDLAVPLVGTPIPLHDAHVGARLSGNPATGLVRGLIRGFVTLADAQNVQFPLGMAIVGGKHLSDILPGGPGNCRTGADSDMDTWASPTGPQSGWYFYFTFEATQTTLTRL